MPITSTDLVAYLSGGASNTDPNASLGGAISSTAIVDATLHNLFDAVSGTESNAGDTEYRCFYFKNNHATLTLQSPKVYIASNTPSADTDVSIGLDPAGVGDGNSTGVATTIADEGTAPSGVTFSQPTSGAPLALPADLGPGQCIAVWVKRVVNAGAAAYNNDQVTISIEGDTAA